MTKIKNIWMVSREMEGIAGAGGVKDVTRQLMAAIAAKGISATVVLPFYPLMYRQNPDLRPWVKETGLSFAVPMDGVSASHDEVVSILRLDMDLSGAPATAFLVDAPCFSTKEGIYTYTASEAARTGRQAGHGYDDFFDMNVTLQKATLELIQTMGARPDLIHCQDAHTAFIPALMRYLPRHRDYFERIGSGITIHNAGPGYHQEIYDMDLVLAKTELPEAVVRQGWHRNAVYPFIVGGKNAGFINTVSENYAREILDEPADCADGDQSYCSGSAGIGAAFQERGIHLTGVTNGIDPQDFDPTNPVAMNIAAAYDPSVGDMAGKIVCRQALLDEVNNRRHEHVQFEGCLDDGPGRVLITSISRLTAQKGVDRLIGAMRYMLEPNEMRGRSDPGVMFLVLGDGDPVYRDQLLEMARDERYAGRVAVAMGYGPRLANRIYAAGDFFVNPAAFEPCGLTDYMAQLMGTVPVVHLVGGLVKVIDGVTGYGYAEHTSEALAAALGRAIDVFRRRPQQHMAIIQQAICTIHERYTWDKVLVQGYMPLYQEAVRKA